MASGIVDLTSDQLRRLARILYRQEVEAIHDIQFTSEPELVHYLRECRKGYKLILQILDASHELVVKYRGDTVKEAIARDIFSYAKIAVAMSLQVLRSFSLRLQYLERVWEHIKEISLDLDTLDRTDLSAVEYLANEAIHYKIVLLEYSSVDIDSSCTLSKSMEESNMTFEDLINKYEKKILEKAAKTGFKYASKKAARLKAYNKIIQKSGASKLKKISFKVASGAAGLAVKLITAGVIVWKLATSHHKVRTAVAGGVAILSSVAAKMIGTAVQTALAAECLCLVGASSVALPVIGFVVTCVAGYVISKIGDYFIDMIFGSESAPALPLSTDGHVCYPVNLPDGKALARQIVHYS